MMPDQLGSLIERVRLYNQTGDLLILTGNAAPILTALEAYAQLLAERTREQRMLDLACYGRHITRDGERVAPGDFYADLPPEPPKG